MKTTLVILALLLQSSIVWAADLTSATTHLTSATIHTTCATEPICGYWTLLNLGDASLLWSAHAVDNGYLYFNTPSEDAPVWEFAPCMGKTLEDLAAANMFTSEFFGLEDPKGPKAFGDKWHGHDILVSTGDILLARQKDTPEVVYALKIDHKDENWRVWVKYRVAVKRDQSAPRWSMYSGIVEENENDVLGSDIILSPEVARAALVKMLVARDPRSPLVELARTGEIVAIRRGLIAVAKRIQCDLKEGAFRYEVRSGGRIDRFIEKHEGVFKREGKEWKASITKSSFPEN